MPTSMKLTIEASIDGITNPRRWLIVAAGHIDGRVGVVVGPLAVTIGLRRRCYC